MAMKLGIKWKILLFVAALAACASTVTLMALHPLKKAKIIALEKPNEMIAQARHLISLSEESNNNYWSGQSKALPSIIRSVDPLNVWVMPSIGVVDVQITSGFYHTGMLLTSSSQSLRTADIVPYPCKQLTPHIYIYKGIIAEAK